MTEDSDPNPSKSRNTSPIAPKKPWSRRRVLLGGALTTLAFGVYGSYKLVFGDATDIVLAVLKRRVGYLDIDEETYQTFAEEYATWKNREALLKRLSIFAAPMRVFTPYSLLRPKNSLRRLEDSIVGQFLLSTDFFQNGADETRKLNYMGFYDPAIMACRNPFARPVSAPG